MSGWRWTQEASDEAIRLAKEGWSGSEIAKAIGAPARNSVINRVGRLGYRLTAKAGQRAAVPWTEEDNAELERLYMGGTSVRACAKALGRTDGTTSHQVKRLGLKRPKVAPRPKPVVALPTVNRDKAWEAREGTTPFPLMDRVFGQCAWPVGEPERPADQLCCGADVPETVSKPYCLHHFAMAVSTRPVSARELTRSLRRYA